MIHITFDALERHKWLHRRDSLEIVVGGGNLKSVQNRSMGQMLTAVTSLQKWRFLRHRWKMLRKSWSIDAWKFPSQNGRCSEIIRLHSDLHSGLQSSPYPNRSAITPRFRDPLLALELDHHSWHKMIWSAGTEVENFRRKLWQKVSATNHQTNVSNQLLHCRHITKVRGDWLYERGEFSLHSGQTVDVENDSNTLEICLEVRPSPNLAKQRVNPLPQSISQQGSLRLKRWSYAFDRHIWSYRIRWDTATNSSNSGIFHMGQNCPTGRTNVLLGGRPGG